MQDRFPWLVQPTDEELERLWQKGTFVFDTNVLLDLYRRSRSFKEDFLDVLKALDGRVWLPHRVVEEFLRHRSGPIASQLSALDSAEDKVRDWYRDSLGLEQLQNDLKDIGRREGPVEQEVDDLLSEKEEFRQAIKEFRNQVLESIDRLREDLLPPDPRAPQSTDDTLAKLEEIFKDRIGDPCDEEKLEDIYEEGQQRYSDNIPPGFEDQDKDGKPQQYADLVIWKQIIRYASSQGEDIVLVTRDTKSDWWEEKSGRTVGPHPYLRKEFHQETSALFWMYRGPEFLDRAKDELAVEVREESIEEARQQDSKSFSETGGYGTSDRPFSASPPWSSLKVPSPFESDDATEELARRLSKEPEIMATFEEDELDENTLRINYSLSITERTVGAMLGKHIKQIEEEGASD